MFRAAQKDIDDWVQEYKLPYWSPLSQFARLAEEVGELGPEGVRGHAEATQGRERLHRDGPGQPEEDLQHADVFYTVLGDDEAGRVAAVGRRRAVGLVEREDGGLALLGPA